MFPELHKQDIVGAHINRAVKVQPLQVLHYSRLIPTGDDRTQRLLRAQHFAVRQLHPQQ